MSTNKILNRLEELSENNYELSKEETFDLSPYIDEEKNLVIKVIKGQNSFNPYLIQLSKEEINQLHKGYSGIEKIEEFQDFITDQWKSKKIKIKTEEDKLFVEIFAPYLNKNDIVKLELNIKDNKETYCESNYEYESMFLDQNCSCYFDYDQYAPSSQNNNIQLNLIHENDMKNDILSVVEADQKEISSEKIRNSDTNKTEKDTELYKDNFFGGICNKFFDTNENKEDCKKLNFLNKKINYPDTNNKKNIKKHSIHFKDNKIKKVKGKLFNECIRNWLNHKSGLPDKFQQFPKEFAANTTKQINKRLLLKTLKEIIFTEKNTTRHKDEYFNRRLILDIYSKEENREKYKFLISKLNFTFIECYKLFLGKIDSQMKKKILFAAGVKNLDKSSITEEFVNKIMKEFIEGFEFKEEFLARIIDEEPDNLKYKDEIRYICENYSMVFG